MAFVDHQSGDHCHGNKTDNVATGRTGKLADSACESGEYRNTDQTDQQIDQITDRAAFPSEQI